MASTSEVIRFEIPQANLSFRAKLLRNENPDVVQQLEAQLPMRSVMGHVVIAGEVFWTPTRIVHTGQNSMAPRRLGAVYLNAYGQSICVQYGKRITESAKINQFAQVFDEDLAVVEKIGKLVWEQTIANPQRRVVECRISVEGASLTHRKPVQRQVSQEVSDSTTAKSHWRNVAALIEKEIDRVWLSEPEEVQKVRWGVIDSGAGSNEQYFTVLVHLEAFLMVMGGDIISRFMRVAQYDDLQLSTLVRMTKEFLLDNFDFFEFIADLGFVSVHKIGQLYGAALETLETKEDYIYLTGILATYINRMHRWSYFIFPWNLGVAFPHRAPSDIHSLAKALTNASSPP